jgi:replicative DNA helicase Mcm
MIEWNYAGEIQAYGDNRPTDMREELVEATRELRPPIDRDLLGAYIAYARSNCFPIMSESAKQVIKDFYMNLRREQEGEAPVSANANEIDTLVRVAEASARLRLSDTVDEVDAKRAVDIVRYTLKQIGLGSETSEFDSDIAETGTSKTQRDRIKNLKHLIGELEDEYDEGAPVSEVISRASKDLGIKKSKAKKEIENLKQNAEVYEPRTDYLRANWY